MNAKTLKISDRPRTITFMMGQPRVPNGLITATATVTRRVMQIVQTEEEITVEENELPVNYEVKCNYYRVRFPSGHLGYIRIAFFPDGNEWVQKSYSVTRITQRKSIEGTILN